MEGISFNGPQEEKEEEKISAISPEDELRHGLEPGLQEIINDLINRFSEKTGIKISTYPKARLFVTSFDVNYDNPGSLVPANYHADSNVITIPYSKIDDREAIGEEIGHFFRHQIFSEDEEKLTSEFFGYLGRRILWGDDKIKTLAESAGTTEEVVSTVKNLDRKSRARKEILEHYRGYYFASRLDISKITN